MLKNRVRRLERAVGAGGRRKVLVVHTSWNNRTVISGRGVQFEGTPEEAEKFLTSLGDTVQVLRVDFVNPEGEANGTT